MSLKTVKKRLDKVIDHKFIEEGVSMAGYTSFKAGGPADLLVSPRSAAELQQVLKILAEEDCPYVILGNGSNLLVRDGGYRGVMVRIGDAFDFVRTDGNCLCCGAGTLLSVAARTASAEGLAGLEFASGIPGTVGGGVFMNAGAYGGELAQVLKSVRLVSKDGREILTMTVAELEMDYRYSRIQETGHIVTEALFALEPGDGEEIRRRIADFTARRNAKQPVAYPSAGSFFKRPQGHFAGKLIEDAGLRGLSIGGAQVSELHCGFIINKKDATATDILQLMEVVQATVLDRFGVKLEPEVRIIGEE